MKNRLGRQVGSNFGVKLACQSESWSEEGQVDATWRAKRHQVGAQKGFGSSQRGSKTAQKGTIHIGNAARVLQLVYVTGVLGSP